MKDRHCSPLIRHLMRSESRYGKRNPQHSNKKDMSTNKPTDDSIDK